MGKRNIVLVFESLFHGLLFCLLTILTVISAIFIWPWCRSGDWSGPWFAWMPIELEEGGYRWLVTVHREWYSGIHYSCWKYRSLKNKT